jgi:hypothetical protein
MGEKDMIFRRYASAAVLLAILIAFFVDDLYSAGVILAIGIASIVIIISDEWTDRHISLLAAATVVTLIALRTLPVPYEWLTGMGVYFGIAVLATGLSVFLMVYVATFLMKLLMRGVRHEFRNPREYDEEF